MQEIEIGSKASELGATWKVLLGTAVACLLPESTENIPDEIDGILRDISLA